MMIFSKDKEHVLQTSNKIMILYYKEVGINAAITVFTRKTEEFLKKNKKKKGLNVS